MAVTCLVSYFTANLLGTKPVYEYLLDRVLDKEGDSKEQAVEVEIVTVVEAGSPVVGKKIRELKWLEGSIIVQIDRGGKLMLPKGDTTIRQNDKLTLHLPPANADEIISSIEKM